MFGLRMPPDLRASLEAAAAKAGRSLNAEICHRLQETLHWDATEARTRESITGDIDIDDAMAVHLQSPAEMRAAQEALFKQMQHELAEMRRHKEAWISELKATGMWPPPGVPKVPAKP